MVTIVIFDDNIHSIERIRELIKECMPADVAYHILQASTMEELSAILADGTQIDILISDIIMPEGQPSGIDVVQRLFPPESGTQVLFASGFLEQAPEVYRTPHLYFLLKPIDPEKLRDALEKACAALADRQPTMLRIKSGHKEHLVNASSISYLESSMHKVSVHSRSGTYETYAKLGDLEGQLPSSFSRCHHSYLVNLAYVSALDQGELQLHDGTIIPVSRRRARQVQHDLLAYLSQ